ncbi:HAD family hydrolase [Actinoplanes teichomyceticus]|uniref:Phosphoglycolate phosphatase-like HAD superfamily hydrolase n=1 Tax=Actinoplanes teichomyceticus TaxID=1867 RepID=A0A561VIM7_ACTTI|nr:HAD family hydrolase [Actinoplanes teichomyceticus]TWG11462.1 phosphoglycolate phosphatase-like HAD superfamily hydrolase [Actinoplanes teichomyceticus]GIF15724.1 phosphatase [Actinoplanes teichomyceticus]
MNVTPTIDHIVWDWNGTIFGDSRALIDATIDAFAACGMAPITRADYQRHHMQPITEFYNRLVGRRLTDREQADLDRSFHEAYARHRARVTLTGDAAEALELWAGTGKTQSLLSMYPHERLLPLVHEAGIAHHFTRIDGTDGIEIVRKAPHLRRHLEHLGLPAERVLIVGDSVDDCVAARECGVHCVVYHAGEDALHAREHFAELDVPIVPSLREVLDRLSHDGDLLAVRALSPETPVVAAVPGE